MTKEELFSMTIRVFENAKAKLDSGNETEEDVAQIKSELQHVLATIQEFKRKTYH